MSEIIVLTDSVTESNCYCLEENGKVLLIDPNDGEKIKHFIKTRHWIIEYVLLTHEHCDHIQGLNELRKSFDFTVIATQKCSENLGDITKNMSRIMGAYLYFKYGEMREYPYGRFQCEPADIAFEETYEFLWQGHNFVIRKTPGHTEGSCCIEMDQAYMFSGDYFIEKEEDITGFPGGSKRDYETKTKPWFSTWKAGLCIYPGHGGRVIL